MAKQDYKKFAGVYALMTENGRQVFVTGHPEYDALTLDKEYRRDVSQGLEIQIPENYYPGGDPEKAPLVSWREVKLGTREKFSSVNTGDGFTGIFSRPRTVYQ